jgi:ribosomal protein S12 methylthiotransferase
MSLSCPKALVDSERINGRLRAEGYELSKVHRDAAAVIVNTCGFLDNAKTETLVASARLGSLSSIEPRSA